MGISLSAYTSPQKIVTHVKEFVTGQKRKCVEDSQEEIDKVIELALHTPKRKKLKTTGQYIYNVLFQEGKDSDVTVLALGHEFHLHKIYLCQSPYFASMFGGSWVESTQKYIAIDVIDPQITIESLKIVFGSLYNDEITLNPREIVSTLATATMFQLDSIIDKCREVMIETINPKSALDYYNAFSEYGDKKLKNICIHWFLVNLLTYYYPAHLNKLRKIPISLMARLIYDSDLFVIQTEFSVYAMLKTWMFIHIHGDAEQATVKSVNKYFFTRKGQESFLHSAEGEKYISAFQGLRMRNLITHHTDIELLQRDNIVPRTWYNPVVIQEWKTMLKVNQNDDQGPPSETVEEVFLKESVRCGRILKEKERHMWRWTGFHYGMDLLMIADGRTFSVKRYHRHEFEHLLSLQMSRRVSIRVRVVKLNEQRQVIYSHTTGYKNISLAKNEETQLLSFDEDLAFPIIVSANILFTSPEKSDEHVTEMDQHRLFKNHNLKKMVASILRSPCWCS